MTRPACNGEEAVARRWSAIGRVPSRPGREIFTISGTSFCISGRSGNMAEAGPQGFFHDDTRYLSGFRIRVNQADPEVVDATQIDTDEAVFFLRSRAREQDPHEEPGLVVRRHRYQGPTLHEDVILDNRTGLDTMATVEVTLNVDFADLFDVRFAGPERERPIHAEPIEHGIQFRYLSESFKRGTRVLTSRPATVDGDHLTLTASIPPNERWKVCIDVIPVEEGRPLPVKRSCTTGDHHRRMAASPRRVTTPPRLRSSADALEHLWAHSLSDLAALEIEMEGIGAYAAGIPWFVALFGRDSIITSIEAMLLDVGTPLGTARLLGRLQGTEDDPAVSEEPGKILHEVRYGERSLPHGRMSHYYGAVDTTPLWLMLLDKLHRWGAGAEELSSLLPHVRAAVGWIRRSLDAGGGFLGYSGDVTRLSNQGWKDSPDSMVDAEGARLEPPIAVVEAQGYAVAGLRAAARLEEELGEASRAEPLRKEAEELQERIEDRFWRDELGTFDMALGRDGAPANTVSSNPGHLLWAEAVSPEKAAEVSRTLTGPALDSGWGLRTLASDHPAYHPVSYHRGSVWPHDTMLAIAGLLSYGLIDEAHGLTGGLLAAAADFSYELPELFSGISRTEVPKPVGYPTSSSPQAWAAAVPIYLTEQLLGIYPDVPHRRVEVRPRLPDGVDVHLEGLRIGDGTLSLRAEGRRAQFLEVPSNIDIVVR